MSSSPTESIFARPTSRSQSRADSRCSTRSFQPQSSSGQSFSLDDPVSVRNHISVLKHSIRHQQAQLQNLESSVQQRASWSSPSPSFDMGFSSPSSELPSYATPQTFRMAKRLPSYEVLQGMAGPESMLPLPLKDGQASAGVGVIKEGVPTTLGGEIRTRSSSPTRTLSRIPVASVGHARTLAEDGQSVRSFRSGSQDVPEPITTSTSSLNLRPPSPNKRLSFGGTGNTSKVLADLQAGVINTKNALENTKAQLRLSQRTVAQLTRQVEDLKDGRERLRLENEGLNNVVSRKERLLQEVLERARKAEAEASTLKAQLKSETTTSKRTIREMEAQVHQSTTTSQKAEREYVTLRDSIKHLTEGWKQDVERLKREMKERESKLRKEAEEAGNKYQRLLDQVEKKEVSRKSAEELRSEDKVVHEKWEGELKNQIIDLKRSLSRSEEDSSMARKTAEQVASELQRLRSLIRAVSTEEIENER